MTDERDGEILNRTYSYWSNALVTADGSVLMFVGHADGQPRFFNVNLESRTVIRLGALLPYVGTGEGWYFDRDGFIYLCDGPRLRRVHPLTGSDVVVLDISESHPGCRINQAHSSDDGTVHSATVELIVSDGAYPKIGTVVQRGGQRHFFQATGVLDESHISGDGSLLLIEEDNGNIIYDFDSHVERTLTNEQGALSHVDCGPDFAVGEDDQAGACTWLDLRTLQRRALFPTRNQGVVSVKGGRCIVTGQKLICLIAVDGSGVTHLAAHGMNGSGYDFMCRANLDPTGRVAMYVSNAAGRMDAYLLAL